MLLFLDVVSPIPEFSIIDDKKVLLQKKIISQKSDKLSDNIFQTYIKLSKVLNDLGMKVAAVSILCQDPRVFFAMEQSGTPCPFEGKIGKAATQQWKKYDKLRPDYDQYVKNLKVVEKANKEEAKKLEKIRIEELEKVQAKLKKLEEEKANKEWSEVDKAVEDENKEKKSLMKKNPPK